MHTAHRLTSPVAASHHAFEPPLHPTKLATMTTSLVGLRATVITVSDRCASGEREDLHGPIIVRELEALGITATAVVVPDGAGTVECSMREAIGHGSRIVMTTGGTGVSPRDLTPEGTSRVIDRLLPGIAELIRAAGIATSAAACLSRGIAGVTSGPPPAFVVNLPGSLGGVTDGLAVVLPLLPHIISQMDGGDH